ncbi:MAG: hypothetical protein IAE67_04185 [Candidatus Competibacteraceae bacterium]|nr:hypothetical protein [Candidatus Competibacteraceae bacterium]
MRKRQVIALFLLLIFATGIQGFSITRHYCTHSGEAFYGLGYAPKHTCSTDLELNQDACCAKEQESKQENQNKSCCATNIESSSHNHTDFTEDCCSDEHAYFQVLTQFLKDSVNLSFLSFYTPPTVIIYYQSYSFFLLQNEAFFWNDPEDISVPDLAYISVFRI